MVSYFGAYAIWGNRGVLVLEDTQAKLGIQQEQLAQLQDSQCRLAHRIALMEQRSTPIWWKNWRAAS